MRIHIATDHAGLEFKDALSAHLKVQGHEVVDHGAYEFDPNDDYPAFIISAAEATIRDQHDGIEALGVVFGGSGNGVRAALVWNESTATLARKHNNANIISIGARQHSENEALRLIDLFIATPFSGDERHVRRIQQIADYEQ
jgi:ribose 5-phosphate isomerase B